MERKDSWTEHDDSLLATTVLSHVRSGSTQLAAFEEASREINRTTSACGFRWNSELRNRYEEEFKAAKEAKKLLTQDERPTRIRRTIERTEELEPIDIDTVFQDLQTSLEAAMGAIKHLKKGFDKLQRDNERLNRRLTEIPQDDLNVLLKLMDQARKLGVIKEGTAS